MVSSILERRPVVNLCAVRDRLHEVQGKRVLVRVDLNVPTGPNHQVLCDYRFRRIVGLVAILVRLRCRVILISHYGRPDGRRDPACSLSPFVAPLQRLLAHKVIFVPNCVGPEVERCVNNSPPGTVLLLENVRFHSGEISADPVFAQQLAQLADCYINDAFSVSHRYHASTVAIPQLLPSYASPSFVHEYHLALNLLRLIKPPVVVISGGRKLDKLLIYKQLMPKIDRLLLGSGFVDILAENPDVLGSADTVGHKIVRPPDLQVRNAAGEPTAVTWNNLAPGVVPIDIGPRAIELYTHHIRTANTLFFNGNPGILEPGHPSASYTPLLEAFMGSKGLKVVFGGTGCSLFMRSGLARRVNYVFPGGGALLCFLNDQSNPAIGLLSRNAWTELTQAAPSRQPGMEDLL